MAGHPPVIRRLFGFPSKDRFHGVAYVTDGAEWSFFWDAHYVAKGLRERCGINVEITQNPWALRNHLIQFGNRYAFFDGPVEKLHSSNRLFLTWFHGTAEDEDLKLREMLERLPAEAHKLEKIVVPCRISKEALIKQGLAEEQLVTIPLGVDLTCFHPPTAAERQKSRARLGVPEDATCIGSFQKDGLGRDEGLEPKLVKGPEAFLDTLRLLARKIHKPFVLLTGPARGYVKKGLEDIGIPYLHHFLSEYIDIVAYYQALDVYLITSLSEGGPKALLESWACGVPLVTTRMGMPADLVRHGQNGMMAEVGDVDALARHVEALMSDADLRERCRQTALEEVRVYDWPLIAESYHKNLYSPFL